jgi:hypothetical protein
MTSDQLEFAISQYLDGTLPAEEEAALVERLATDPQARELFAEYEKLNTVVKSAMPLPGIDWSSFSQQVSSAVEREEAPVKTFKLPMAWIGSIVALAACIAIGFGIFFNRPGQQGPKGRTEVSLLPHKSIGSITIKGPAIERATHPALAQVTVSAPSSLAQGRDWRYAQEIVTRPSRVIIASSAESAQDNASLPY